MRYRSQFPADLSLLLTFLLMPIPAMLLVSALSPLISWFRHPTPTAWLWAVGISLGASLLGAALLFIAKLPAYRVGNFLRIGRRHLPERYQRMYLVSFRIIIPAILMLTALVAAGRRF
jgi:hypothetical protein